MGVGMTIGFGIWGTVVITGTAGAVGLFYMVFLVPRAKKKSSFLRTKPFSVCSNLFASCKDSITN